MISQKKLAFRPPLQGLADNIHGAPAVWSFVDDVSEEEYARLPPASLGVAIYELDEFRQKIGSTMYVAYGVDQ